MDMYVLGAPKKYFSFVELNTGTSFLGMIAMRSEIFNLKTQICICLQTRAMAFGVNKLLMDNE